jgi:hypothetical protein
MDLDRVPLWRGDHVSVRQLWSDYAQYLPRLRDSAVLLGAVQDGVALLTWNPDTFAYASAVDETTGRYVGPVAGMSPSGTLDGVSVVVSPEVTQRQIKDDRRQAEETAGRGVQARGAEARDGDGGRDFDGREDRAGESHRSSVRRTVTENARTLRFDTHEFEAE